MIVRPVLCAIAAGWMVAGCFEAARNPWVKQTSVVREEQAQPTRTVDQKRPVEARSRTAAAPNTKRGECLGSEQCAALLKSMIADPTRGWIQHRPHLSAYANGTRLFAYRSLRTKLQCHELGIAVGELDAVRQSLIKEPAIIAASEAIRVRNLLTDVTSELRMELARRCPPNVKTLSG
jgi:hypothetical protein